MTKKIKENDQPLTKEEIEEIKEGAKEVKKEIKEHKYPINSFVEENKNVRKRVDAGFAFKTWYKLKKQGSFHDKKTMDEWEVLHKKFMTEPTR